MLPLFVEAATDRRTPSAARPRSDESHARHYDVDRESWEGIGLEPYAVTWTGCQLVRNLLDRQTPQAGRSS